MHRRPASPTCAFALAALLALPALAALPVRAEPASPALVTLTGAIENTNRGAVDPDWDLLFLSTNVEFEAARALSHDDLRALPQTTVRADFPKGAAETRFTGPSFEALFEAAGATGETVFIMALDGYAAQVPVADLIANGGILAIERDGKPLDIGGVGPAMVAFPRAERPELAEMGDENWVYQVFHVRVE